ncbi:hypothetical protein ES703_90566 [subsurface metagenome]
MNAAQFRERHMAGTVDGHREHEDLLAVDRHHAVDFAVAVLHENDRLAALGIDEIGRRVVDMQREDDRLDVGRCDNRQRRPEVLGNGVGAGRGLLRADYRNEALVDQQRRRAEQRKVEGERRRRQIRRTVEGFRRQLESAEFLRAEQRKRIAGVERIDRRIGEVRATALRIAAFTGRGQHRLIS